MPLTLRFAVRSDMGLVRESNEDSVFAAPHLLVVADGMGGHAGGEIASASLIAHMARIAPVGLGEDASVSLVSGIDAGNRDIARTVAQRPELEGMGTTVTAVLLTADGAYAVTNIGDSRTYLLRNAELSLLTRDDSLIQSLMDNGRITEAEAAVHPHRSVVTRAVVGDAELVPSVSMTAAAPGDRLLLCSDGLTDLVSHEEIAAVLRGEDPETVADGLLRLALHAGGSDNVTVIVADTIAVEATGTAEPSAPVEPGAAGGDRRMARLILLLAAAGLLLAGAAWFLLRS